MERNHWRNAACEQVAFPALQSDISVDFAVIGGGYTGLNAARVAAMNGMSVCLIEANSIGYGGSGRNVGLVNAGLWLPPDEIKKTLGQSQGMRLITDLGQGPDDVFDLIKTYEIQCDARRSGTLHLAHSAHAVTELEDRCAQWNALGAPVSVLNRDDTARRVGSAHYHGALFDARAGVIQPLDYARGLARAAQMHGVKIYENTVAMRIIQDSAWCIETPNGKIYAANLLIATNAYSQQMAGVDPCKTSIVSYFQCVSGTIDKFAFDHILSGNEGCWDTALIMSSFRKTRDNRLVFGAMGESSDLIGEKIHGTWARRAIRRIFPNVNIQLSRSWSGKIAMTQKKIPEIVKIGKGCYSIFGYSGRGIAPGTVIGKQFGHFITTGDPDELCIRTESGYSEYGTKLKSLYYESGTRLSHIIKSY